MKQLEFGFCEENERLADLDRNFFSNRQRTSNHNWFIFYYKEYTINVVSYNNYDYVHVTVKNIHERISLVYSKDEINNGWNLLEEVKKSIDEKIQEAV